MSLFRRLFYTASFSLVTDLVVKLLNFVTGRYHAVMLGEAGLGLLAGQGAVLSLLGVVPPWGQDIIFSREAGRDHDSAGEILFNTVLLRLTMGVLGYGVLLWLLFSVGLFPELRWLLAISGINYLFQSLQPFRQAFDLELQPRFPHSLKVAVAVVNLLGMVLLLWLGFRVMAVVAFGTLVGVTQQVILTWGGARLLRPIPRLRPDLLWRIFREGFWLVIPVGIIALYTRIDQIFIFRWLGEEYTGQYRVAVTLTELLHLIPIAIVPLLTPHLSRVHALDSPGFVEFYQRVFRLMNLMVWPLCLSVFLWSDWLVALYAPGFRGSATALRLLIWSEVWVFLGIVNHTLLVVIGRQRLDTIFVSGNCLLNILLNIWWIPWFGIAGAAAATSVGLAFGMFGGLYFAETREFSRCQYQLMARGLAGTLAGGAVAWLLGANSLTAVSAGAAACVGVLVALGGFGLADLAFWRTLRGKELG